MPTGNRKYERVMNDLRAKIVTHKYPVDKQLPSEAELQSIYGVSRVTIRQAVDGLVKSGLVERVQGVGSFARKPQQVSRLIRSQAVESFSKLAHDNGLTTHTKIMQVKKVLVTTELEAELETKEDCALKVVRLRYLDDDPMFLECNYFPLPRFNQLQTLDLSKSLYQLLEDEFGITKFQSGETLLSVTTANIEQARLMNRVIGFPLYDMQTQIRDEAGTVIQFGKDLIATDRYQFSI